MTVYTVTDTTVIEWSGQLADDLGYDHTEKLLALPEEARDRVVEAYNNHCEDVEDLEAANSVVGIPESYATNIRLTDITTLTDDALVEHFLDHADGDYTYAIGNEHDPNAPTLYAITELESGVTT